MAAPAYRNSRLPLDQGNKYIGTASSSRWSLSDVTFGNDAKNAGESDGESEYGGDCDEVQNTRHSDTV